MEVFKYIDTSFEIWRKSVTVICEEGNTSNVKTFIVDYLDYLYLGILYKNEKYGKNQRVLCVKI